MSIIPSIETCDYGHRFGFLPDHPRKDGLKRCPHCMAIGLDALLSERTLNAAPQAGGEQSSSSAPEVTQSPAVAALREVILAWEQNLEDEAAFDMAQRDLTRSHDLELKQANESFESLRLAVKSARERFL